MSRLSLLLASFSIVVQVSAASLGDPQIFVVGEIENQVVSSRDVTIAEKIERALYNPKLKSEIPIKGDDFKKLVTATLLECMIDREAHDIQASGVTQNEVDQGVAQVRLHLTKDKQWQELDVHSIELKTAVQRKLVAKKFIKFKANSSVVKVSDQEALAYYEANRERFGQLPFSHFKGNIRAFLMRRQLDERLRDWFEVLQAKYNAKNLSNEF